MSPNISYQIRELAKCANQEILMNEASSRHVIKSFGKVEDGHSFEFKNSFESPYRYVFKRRLKSSNSQVPTILITADFLDKELKLYETRKDNLHHYLVFMYNDCMIKFDMRDIREWIMKEGPNPKSAQVRNKKCQDGSFARCAEMVYYIPASVPRVSANYISSEKFRSIVYSKWNCCVVSAPYILADQIRITTLTQQVVSISPYF